VLALPSREPGAEDTRAQEQKAPGFLERTDVLAEMMFRLGAMGETLLGGHDQHVIDEHEHLACRLPAKGYGILEFDLSPERMAPIVDAGGAAMEAQRAAWTPTLSR
jgi:hypothetical protein